VTLPAAHDNEPVFAEPWQAEAFALTLALTEAGHVSRAEWTGLLSAAIAAQPDGDYYEQWVSALETLCAAHGIVDSEAIDQREDEWRQAYLRTPHGAPVNL
jgi:nitrile hydratase accessory protein